MKNVTYAGKSFLTTDDMASALMDFTAETARHFDASPVSVPSLDARGGVMHVDLVVGPSSEVFSAPSSELGTLVDFGREADALRARTAEMLAERNSRVTGLPLDSPVPAIDDVIS